MFEWDAAKNEANISKHGISFQTAWRIFEQPVLSVVDDRHDYGETRKISIGRVGLLGFLAVVHTDRDGAIRIIPHGPRSGARGHGMSRRYAKEMTEAELVGIADEDIDTGDIPELGDDFWQKAQLVEPDPMQTVTLQVKQSVLDAFRAEGEEYQTRMTTVLESYVRTLTQR